MKPFFSSEHCSIFVNPGVELRWQPARWDAEWQWQILVGKLGDDGEGSATGVPLEPVECNESCQLGT